MSGPFRQVERGPDHLVLERQPEDTGTRSGNVARVEFVRRPVREGMQEYRRGAVEAVPVRYTRPIADFDVPEAGEAHLGPAGWSGYVSFDHRRPPTSNLDLRRALAHAVDRQELARVFPPNLMVATGGVVPPALQGHTPDIAPRFEPDRARELLTASGVSAGEVLAVAAFEEWEPAFRIIADTWREVLGLDVELRLWTATEGVRLRHGLDLAPMALSGWLPGYPDPEYFLRLLLHSDARTNEGGFAYPAFDELIERARQERVDRLRLEWFHEADRLAVVDRVAVIPLAYGRSLAFVKPEVNGWWEFGKSSSPFADLVIES